MENETIDLNTDHLKRMEDELRTTGAWADFRGNKGVQHYYIAKNPKIDTAISLCRESIKTFDNLTITSLERKCFVCSLLANHRLKEVMQDQAEQDKSNEDA